MAQIESHGKMIPNTSHILSKLATIDLGSTLFQTVQCRIILRGQTQAHLAWKLGTKLRPSLNEHLMPHFKAHELRQIPARPDPDKLIFALTLLSLLRDLQSIHMPMYTNMYYIVSKTTLHDVHNIMHTNAACRRLKVQLTHCITSNKS